MIVQTKTIENVVQWKTALSFGKQMIGWGGPCGDNDLSTLPGKYSWKSGGSLFSKTIARRVSDPPGKSILMVLKNIKKYEGSWEDF